MSSDDIISLILFSGVGSVFLVIIVVGALAARKAERICRELVANNFQELRLVNDCRLSSGFVPDIGILALLNDRMTFVSTLFDKRMEIPLTQITAVKVPKLSWIPNRSQTRQFEIQADGKKIKITMNMYIMNAWVTALEKSAPMLAAKYIMPT
jgi:hypothetical protein